MNVDLCGVRARLNRSMQSRPHDGVAAEAESAPMVLTPPTRASVAAPARSLLLKDMVVPFMEPTAVPCVPLCKAGLGGAEPAPVPARPAPAPDHFGLVRTGTAGLTVLLF